MSVIKRGQAKVAQVNTRRGARRWKALHHGALLLRGTLALCALLITGSGLAQNAAPTSDVDQAQLETEGTAEAGPRPWADSVPPDAQAAARDLFTAGNALLAESLLKPAIEKYTAALKHWDHPAIHYNLSLALLNLDAPLQVRQHLQKALAYEGAALGTDKAEQAQRYLNRVEGSLAYLYIRCEQAGTKVSLDGQELFTGPGEFKGYVLPGERTLRATKPGHTAMQRALKLVPGESASETLRVYKPDELLRYRRRWERWGPVAVTGTGFAILGAGGMLTWHAQRSSRAYDAEVTRSCGRTGCLGNPDVDAARERTQLYETLGIASMAVGGATLVTGAVLLYMNRTVPYRLDPDELKDRALITPYVAPNGGGIAAVGRF